jgi:hypothetical protein
VDRSYKNHLDRNFGPLRWWHVPGWDIGTCDYRAMSGSILVESGTFKAGQSAMRSPATTRKSRWVRASVSLIPGPTMKSAFNYIETFERSLLPSLKASNWLTRLFISKKQKEEPKMLSQKAKELIELLGSDEQAISDVTDIHPPGQRNPGPATKNGHSVEGCRCPPAAAADPTWIPEDLVDGGADEDLEDGTATWKQDPSPR